MGIDWFTEIFFFYGTLCGICWWEFNKFVESQRKLRLRLTQLEGNTEEILSSLARVKERQIETRDELEEVLSNIRKIAENNQRMKTAST